MTFPSKVDSWLWLVVAIPLLLTVCLPVVLIQAQPTEMILPLLITLISTLLPGIFMVWICTTTAYTIRGNDLLIRSGPFSWQIPIESITHVKATHNPLSSPALSLDRLEISYGERRKIMISPKDKAGFLQAINHNLEAS